MLYLFDLDGTLISGYMDNPDRDYHTWQPCQIAVGASPSYAKRVTSSARFQWAEEFFR
jgi:hypothetical protein